jgi:hypothetical protein
MTKNTQLIKKAIENVIPANDRNSKFLRMKIFREMVKIAEQQRECWNYVPSRKPEMMHGILGKGFKTLAYLPGTSLELVHCHIADDLKSIFLFNRRDSEVIMSIDYVGNDNSYKHDWAIAHNHCDRARNITELIPLS